MDIESYTQENDSVQPCNKSSLQIDSDVGSQCDQIDDKNEIPIAHSNSDISIRGEMANEKNNILKSEETTENQQPEFNPLCNSQEQDADASDSNLYIEQIDSHEEIADSGNEFSHLSICSYYGEKDLTKCAVLDIPSGPPLKNIFDLPYSMLYICNQVVHEIDPQDTTTRKKSKIKPVEDEEKVENQKITKCKSFLEKTFIDVLKLFDPKNINPRSQKELFWIEMLRNLEAMVESMFKEVSSGDRKARIFDPLLKLSESDLENCRHNSGLVKNILNRFDYRAKRLLKNLLRKNNSIDTPGLEYLNVQCSGPLTFDDLNVLFSEQFDSFLHQNKQNNEKKGILKQILIQQRNHIQTVAEKFAPWRQRVLNTSMKPKGVEFFMHCNVDEQNIYHLDNQKVLLIEKVPEDHVQKALSYVFQKKLQGITECDYKKALACICPAQKQSTKQISNVSKPSPKKQITKSSKKEAKQGSHINARMEDSSIGKRSDNGISCFDSTGEKKLRTIPSNGREQYVLFYPGLSKVLTATIYAIDQTIFHFEAIPLQISHLIVHYFQKTCITIRSIMN